MLRHGRRSAAAHFVVLVAASPAETRGKRPRLGLTVGRRVGNAVVRNRVKRRVREWFRASRSGLAPSADLVVIGRRGAGALSGREVAEALDRLVEGSEQRRA